MKQKPIRSTPYTVVCFMLLLLLVLFSGCAKKPASSGFDFKTSKVDGKDLVNNTFVTGLPIVKDPITLKIMVTLHPQTERNDYNKKPFTTIAEKATGVKIDWILPADDAIPAILASNDLPDVFWRNMPNDADMVSGQFIELTDEALKIYAPTVLDIYEKYIPDWRGFLTQGNGKIHSLMGYYYISYNHLTDETLYINTEWLKQVGKTIPTTTTELYDVLKAFKEKDANGNGDPNDEIPFDFCNNQWAAGFADLAGSWGIYNTYNVKGGKVSASVNLPEYREYLEYYHILAKEGLINVEGFSQTVQQYFADIAANKTGVFGGMAPNTFISDPVLMHQFVPLGIIAVPGKENLRIAYSGAKTKSMARRNNYAITRTCKYPEAALRWWDYLSGDDMAGIVFAGVEGIAWKRNGFLDYELLMPPEEQVKKDGVSSAGQYQQTMGYNNYFPLVLNVMFPDFARYPDLDTSQRRNAIDKIYQFLSDEPLPTYAIPKAAQDERTLIETDLLPVINSFRANSVINGVTDTSWNVYLKQLETYRYNDYLAWHQRWYDHKL